MGPKLLSRHFFSRIPIANPFLIEEEDENDTKKSDNLSNSHGISERKRKKRDEQTIHHDRNDTESDIGQVNSEYYNYEDYYDVYEESSGGQESSSVSAVDNSFTSSKDDYIDEISRNLPRDVYCDLVNKLSQKCLATSILEMWKFDESIIKNLSQQNVIDALNSYVERLRSLLLITFRNFGISF